MTIKDLVLALLVMSCPQLANAAGLPASNAESCALKADEKLQEVNWTLSDGDEKTTYTEYLYQTTDPERVEALLGTTLSSAKSLEQLRAKVAAGSETNAMVLLDRYLKAEKSRNPGSANVANATLVLEHQAGQVFQMSCIESILLGKLLDKFPTRKVEVNYLLFGSDSALRIYFALPNTLPSTKNRLVLRSKLAQQHLKSGELEAFDLRIIGMSQGFIFSPDGLVNGARQALAEVAGGELVPDHTRLPALKAQAEEYSAHVAMTNGFETLSYDSYELGLMSCPQCR